MPDSLSATNLQQSLAETFSAGLATLQIAFSEQQIEQSFAFLALLAKWNRVHNLTAITEPKEMLVKHLLDSLSVLHQLPAGTVLDVGSGAGIPGIPLAIALPLQHFTLIDASEKKSAFQREAVRQLALDNVAVVNGRVEAYRGGPFSVVLARAFSALDMFIDVTHPLVGSDGYWLAMKGQLIDDELQALALPEHRVHRLRVPGLNADRHLIIIPRT